MLLYHTTKTCRIQPHIFRPVMQRHPISAVAYIILKHSKLANHQHCETKELVQRILEYGEVCYLKQFHQTDVWWCFSYWSWSPELSHTGEPWCAQKKEMRLKRITYFWNRELVLGTAIWRTVLKRDKIIIFGQMLTLSPFVSKCSPLTTSMRWPSI